MHVEDIKIPGQTTLAAKLYLPRGQGPFPGVLLCHGFASCKEEFMALPHALCNQGLGVMTFDFSGHGESSGVRGYVSEHSHLDDTLRAFQTLIDRPEIQSDRTAVIGHSLGTSAVLRFMGSALAKDVVCGAILAPMHKTSDSVKPVEQSAYTALAHLAKPLLKFTGRHIYIPYRVKPQDIYVSKEAIERARMIKLLLPQISVHNYDYLMVKQDNIRYAQTVTKPMLVMAAEKDALISPEQSKAVFSALKSADKQWHLIPDSGHSLLGDKQAKMVTALLVQWLQTHLLSMSDLVGGSNLEDISALSNKTSD